MRDRAIIDKSLHQDKINEKHSHQPNCSKKKNQKFPKASEQSNRKDRVQFFPPKKQIYMQSKKCQHYNKFRSICQENYCCLLFLCKYTFFYNFILLSDEKRDSY